MARQEPTTTMQIYASDSEWFRAWQRTISAREGKWLNLPDSIRALIRELEAQAEGGA